MQIYVEEDEFLKRVSGTRGAGLSSFVIVYRKDVALREYLKHFDHTKVCNSAFVLSYAHNKRPINY